MSAIAAFEFSQQIASLFCLLNAFRIEAFCPQQLASRCSFSKPNNKSIRKQFPVRQFNYSTILQRDRSCDKHLSLDAAYKRERARDANRLTIALSLSVPAESVVAYVVGLLRTADRLSFSFSFRRSSKADRAAASYVPAPQSRSINHRFVSWLEDRKKPPYNRVVE